VVPLAKPQERGAKNGIPGEIERPQSLLRGQAPGVRLAFTGSQMTELDDAQVERQAGGNNRGRMAIARRETGAQNLVAIDCRVCRRAASSSNPLRRSARGRL